MKDMNNNTLAAMNSTVCSSGIDSNRLVDSVLRGPYAPLLWATVYLIVDRVFKTIDNAVDKGYTLTHKRGENTTSFAPKDN